MASEYMAALRTHTDPNGTTWDLTNNVERVLAAEPQDIIWVESLDDLGIKLAASRPTPPDSALTYIRLERSSGYRAIRYDHVTYLGTNTETIAELTRKHGPIRCPCGWNNTGMRARGCVMDEDSRMVRFDPKLLKKAPKPRKVDQTKRRVTLRDMNYVIGEVGRSVLDIAGVRLSLPWSLLREPTRSNFRLAILVCEAIFGPHSYRKLEAFQLFLDRWRGNPAGNADRWQADMSRFVAAELSAPKPKTKKLTVKSKSSFIQKVETNDE